MLKIPSILEKTVKNTEKIDPEKILGFCLRLFFLILFWGILTLSFNIWKDICIGIGGWLIYIGLYGVIFLLCMFGRFEA